MFGIAHLAAFLTAPVFAQWGSRIGPKLLYTCGSITESLSGGILFGTLAYVSATGAFLGLSYFLRSLCKLLVSPSRVWDTSESCFREA